jgi:hypothetical protein
MDVFGSDGSADFTNDFNSELLHKFTREVKYRLDEILASVASQDTIATESLIVFEHHDKSTHLHGNFQGSNIAIGGSTVSASTTNYATSEDLARALTSLKPLIHDLVGPQREVVDNALDLLTRASHDSSVTEEQVANAAQTICVIAPTIYSRIKDIAGTVSAVIAKQTLILVLKHQMGLP